MVNCSLGDDRVHYHETTCSFACNTGYELTGSDTRSCQSDGSWNGTDNMCRRGTKLCYYIVVVIAIPNFTVFCQPFGDLLNNGVVNCSLGDDGVHSYKDICNISCNSGYELTGSDTRTCQSDGSWSGAYSVCKKGTYVCKIC